MENIITIMTYIIGSTITYFIVFDFFDQKYLCKFKQSTKIILLILMIITNDLISFIDNVLINILMNILLYVMINNFIYEIKQKNDYFINAIFFLSLILLVDIIIHVLCATIFSYEGMNIEVIISAFFKYVIYKLLRNYLLTKEINNLKKQDAFSYAIVLTISFIVGVCSVLFIEKAHISLNVFLIGLLLIVASFNIYYLNVMESQSQLNNYQSKMKFVNFRSRVMYKQYQKLKEKDDAAREVLHDIKNHIHTLESVISKENSAELQYLDKIKDRIKTISSQEVANRKILNILLQDKKEEAEKYQIKMNFNIDYIDLAFIDDYDLVTLFSNILDNAIEAVKELNIADRHINLFIKNVATGLLIKESNPCNNQLIKEQGVIQTTKNGHSGQGLLNVQEVVNKYNANMIVDIQNNEFSNTIFFFKEIMN